MGRAKRYPYQFFPCNFFKIITSASPNLLNLNQEHHAKNCFFWSNSNKIGVDNFSYRNARVTKL